MIAWFKRRWRRIALVCLTLLLLCAAGLYWLRGSGIIEQYIRERAIAEVAKAMGARLELGTLRLDFWRGQATIDGITIHGKEPADSKPLFTAKTVVLSIRIASFSRSRIDLRALTIESPRINLITLPDGTTNLPTPPTQSASSAGTLQSLIDLRLGRLDITGGEFSWNYQPTPFQVNATDLKARLDFLAPSRTYKGQLDASMLSYTHASLAPISGSANIELAITSEKINIDRAIFRTTPGSTINARGNLIHLDTPDTPFRLDLDMDASLKVSEALPYVTLPLDKTGTLQYTGKLFYEAHRGFELHGDARARDLYYRDASSGRIGPIRADARFDLLPARLTLSKLRADAFSGTLIGDFLWDPQEGWRFDGDLANINTATVLSQLNVKSIPWTGQIEGPITAQGGKKPLVFNADLVIQAKKGPSPLEGLLAVTYDDSANRLVARPSFLALPHTRLNFAGDLSKGIALEFRSTAFRELTPLVELAGLNPNEFQFDWTRGAATLAGQLSGSTRNPQFRGTLDATDLNVAKYKIDHLRTAIDYNNQLLQLNQIDAAALGSTLKGNLSAVLEDARFSSGSLLSGRLDLNAPDLTRLPIPEPVKGSVTTTISVRGTVGEPSIDGTLRAPTLEARDFRFTQVSAAYTANPRELRIAEWEVRLGRQPLRGILNVKTTRDDWSTGTGNATLKVESLPLDSIPQYREQNLNVSAQLNTDTQIDFGWSAAGVAPTRIDGKLQLANITRYGRPVGQLELTSRTTGQRAALTATGSIQQLPIKGDASIQFGNRLDSELRLQLPRLDFPTIAQLFSAEVLPTPLPYEGGAEASFYFKGPLLDPGSWDGRLTIPQVQLAPNKEYVRESMPTVAGFILRNESPIVVEFRRGLIGARDVRLLAKDTNLTATLLYRTNNGGLTGNVKGTINLAALSTLKPDLLASGAALLDTSIQGTSADPQINGRLSFQNASFYLRDVITGLDKVNGTLLFDKSRATIDSLEAQTGGGKLQLTGFVGFGRILSYRLQAQADQVRLRYPEGVSTSANATLALTGTTAQSILTGNVTILRSSIGQVDTGQFLATNSGVTDTSAPISNEFLRNLLFDVRVEAAQNIEISTAFTKDVKGEISLRLRGTPQRPIILGRIAVTQGEVDFFGSRYQISRGEVNFTNPLRIEPSIGLDLETRVRGVAISISFNGPASKLNMSYRSDPPLQSGEILALLTVGRNPGSTSSVAQQAPMGQTQGMFGNDSSMIVGAAVTAGINGRLQRFFGISRVRLDPQLTGIDNVPQARLTLEQQVSRDVTLTYITNLNRTQQQIVRLDWDISRNWSVVAVRDENGIFGIDLNFRRRVR